MTISTGRRGGRNPAVTERTTEQAPAGASRDRDAAAGSATMDTVTDRPRPSGGRDRAGPVVGRGERVFRAMTSGSGLLVVAADRRDRALPARAGRALAAGQQRQLPDVPQFDTRDPANLNFGIRDLFVVTVLSSVFALVLAMPVALGIALFLTHYAPKRVARPFAYVVDLLAAVPSIVYGLWGIMVLAPALLPIATLAAGQPGWFFLFAPGTCRSSPGRSSPAAWSWR